MKSFTKTFFYAIMKKDSHQARGQLIKLVDYYFTIQLNEKEILNQIKNFFGHLEYDEEIEYILDDLDEIFEKKKYLYYEYLFTKYEQLIDGFITKVNYNLYYIPIVTDIDKEVYEKIINDKTNK